MAKFLIVKELPTNTEPGDYLIDKPNFLDEVLQHKSKAPRNKLTAPHHLRGILDTIAHNYDPENMTAYTIKVHKYEGRPFASDEELSDILVEAIRAEHPSLFTKYLDKKIKLRPKDTKTIYLLDTKIPFAYETFYQNGLSDIAEEERSKRKEQEAVEKAERSEKWRKQQEAKKQKEQ